VLDTAIELATHLDADLQLVRVVPTLTTLSGHQAAAGTLLPTTTSAYLDIAEDEACEYLGEKLELVRLKKLAVTAEVRRGDPAEEVVKSAGENNSKLILLGTHGKAGMKAFWSASTAPRIVSKTEIPILLIPVRSK
jgi:nucleotide-binding universal stress UspA family protein